MLIRIITENNPLLPDIVSRYFEGFTMYNARGFWKGKPESSMIIEIDTEGSEYNPLARINSIVDDIKTKCNQESVLVQTFIGCQFFKSEIK